MNDPALTKIAFTSEDGQVETLWAFDLGQGRYKLDSTPWYQYGVSCQDVVAAEPDQYGQLCFTRVIAKSGVRTLRVRSDEPVPETLLARLVTAGCEFEGANPRFIGIDVPPGIELAMVTDLLAQSGLEWEYADPTYEKIHGDEA